MALKYQFNKTAMQALKKNLQVRLRALPTLKAKETALRLEVKRAKEDLEEAKKAFHHHKEIMLSYAGLWEEFPADILRVQEVQLTFRKIAGVQIPQLGDVTFSLGRNGLFGLPAWLGTGIDSLKESAKLNIRIDIAEQKCKVLEYARKKTTQKVNLYEKVQIPELNTAILKIKRFLEDQENLEKSSQKILKTKLSLIEEELAA